MIMQRLHIVECWLLIQISLEIKVRLAAQYVQLNPVALRKNIATKVAIL